MLLEALCGADYEEIKADYMETYANYYGITAETEPEKYGTIVESVLNPMLASLLPDAEADLRTADLSGGAKSFLLNGGMRPEQIEALKTKLCAAA